MTKQDNLPVLSLTIITNTYSASRPAQIAAFATSDDGDGDGREDGETGNSSGLTESGGGGYSDRETTITQSVPVMVLPAATVSGIHEPRCRDPDVHIMLPPLSQLKSISDRFTKLALSTSSSSGGLFGTAGVSSSSQQPQPFASLASSSRLVLSANMHGALRIGVTTAALKIESKWEGLINPELDPGQVEGGEEGVRGHASTVMKAREGEESWATVRVEGKDWGRVLGVGRLGGKVVACGSSFPFPFLLFSPSIGLKDARPTLCAVSCCVMGKLTDAVPSYLGRSRLLPRPCPDSLRLPTQ